jgi:intraflagellar transport protein 140
VPCLHGARCAEAFLGAGHYDKAASLLARVGQISRALDLLQAHDLPLSEELAEALTPPKEAPGGAGERQAVLLRLAQVGGEGERSGPTCIQHTNCML